jgi:hypothetical protein
MSAGERRWSNVRNTLEIDARSRASPAPATVRLPALPEGGSASDRA